ncbi:tetratricopeptide repeat (TPR)-like superfamily protein [Artemisia annua]|uniref:Tetratricopeptide repeat (TPR)-like superfamily protein n=1 Tax=Artemisia annua TaxID=35608 RepID=A0A2U1QJB7_ARTAN|nr:tetratricopeptide repeat (TPR)-like superfamily protein [Artemisia annua]
MTQQRPLPSADEFTKLLEVIKKHDFHFYKKGLVSYTTLFDGLISENRINEAHGLFKKLVEYELCQPDTVMYNTIIKALCSFSINNRSSALAAKMKMDDAFKLLKDMVSGRHISPDVVTYNSLISGRCKQTNWWEAKFLLDDMFDKHHISPNVETFNILVNAFCKKNRIEEAHDMIYLMQERGIVPNTATFNSLVDAYRLNGEFTKARSLIELMMSRDITAPDAATYNSLLYAYCEDVKMDDAMLIYHEMNGKVSLKPKKKSFVLEKMIRLNRAKSLVDAFIKYKYKGNFTITRSFLKSPLLLNNNNNAGSVMVKNTKLNDALNLFNKMTLQRPLPWADEFTKLLEVIKKHDFHFYKKGLVSYTTLFDGLISENRINEAHGLFKKLVEYELCQPDTLLYNTIIKALCSFSINNSSSALAAKIKMDDASKLLKDMVSRRHISPDVVTYNSLISGRCKQTNWWGAKFLLDDMIEEAHDMIYLMQERGIVPNTATFNSLVDAYCLNGEFTKARSLIELMMSRDITAPDAATYNSLLYAYCENVKMDDAMLIYHEMNGKGLKPDYVTYNTMISRLFMIERSEEARKILDDMRAQGQMLDEPTYCDILHDLCCPDRFEEALSLFHFVGDDGKLNSNISVYNFLIDAAIECHKLHIARELFKDLSVKGMEPDHQTYTTMIAGFCGEGLMQDAKQLFLKLHENGWRPNTDTYNLLVQGYLKAKCYDDVKRLLQKMARTHHRLDVSTSSLLRDSIEAGLLHTAMLTLIHKLAPVEEMDYSSSSD